MPKQPAVSIRGEIYEKIKAHCQKTGEPIAVFVDRICSEFFKGEEPVKKPAKKPVKKPAAPAKKTAAKPPKNGDKKAPDMKKLRF